MELGKVLLVGSTGYLGSHLATSLGLDVIARSETTKQSRDRSFDTIIHASHFGDLTAEKEFISSLPGDCYFVFFSSAAVYGDTGLEGASVEDEPKPINDYGRYKLELENLIRNKFPQHLILRISNPYGKENRPGGAYQIFKQAIADKQPVKIYADQPETVFRDFIYIDDFISQASTAIKQKQQGLMNISSGKAISLEDFARSIDPELEPLFEYQGTRANEINYSVLIPQR